MFARCQFGRSRFSRCCNLIFDLAPSFEWRVGPGDCLSRRNSAVETRQFRSWSPVLRSVGAGCGVVRRPHRSPTVDEAVWPTSVPPPPPLVSSHSCRRARPAASRRRPAFSSHLISPTIQVLPGHYARRGFAAPPSRLSTNRPGSAPERRGRERASGVALAWSRKFPSTSVPRMAPMSYYRKGAELLRLLPS
jgi:hypothetical protein